MKDVFNNKNIKIIPQSVIYYKPKFFNLRNIFSAKKIYIMTGNLREVKDPLYLNEVFRKLHSKGIILVIIGSILSGEYKFSDGIKYIGPLPQEKVYSCMEQADGFINTSKSEGMAISILEAMLYKCPVYVRDNEGNKSIVKDKVTGYIFKNQDEFLEKLELDTVKIVDNAYNYVLKNHNHKLESSSYKKILPPNIF